MIINDVKNDPRYYPKVAESIGVPARSLLAVPLQFRDRKIGVLEAENKKHKKIRRAGHRNADGTRRSDHDRN